VLGSWLAGRMYVRRGSVEFPVSRPRPEVAFCLPASYSFFKGTSTVADGNDFGCPGTSLVDRTLSSPYRLSPRYASMAMASAFSSPRLPR
jgi:hypothetical protein